VHALADDERKGRKGRTDLMLAKPVFAALAVFAFFVAREPHER
jgi:hypothetical protein